MAISFTVVTKTQMQDMLRLHGWFLANEARSKVLVDRIFSERDDRIFPFAFQHATEETLTAPGPSQLTLPEARFIYDSAYRMIYEMVLGRSIGRSVGRKDSACIDANCVPIPLNQLARPAGFYD